MLIFCIYLRNIIVKNQQQNIMRKLLLLLSLFIVADVVAGPVGYEAAKKIAEEFASMCVEVDKLREEMRVFRAELEQFRRDFDEVYADADILN